jgi:hypothetical protein
MYRIVNSVPTIDNIKIPKTEKLSAASRPSSAYSNVFLPYTTIALTPDICWSQPM